MPRAVASSHQVVMGINDTLQQTLCVVPLSAFQLLLSIRNVSGWTTRVLSKMFFKHKTYSKFVILFFNLKSLSEKSVYCNS